MTPAAIREVVLSALLRVAPEADPALLNPQANLRDQLDIDSMDFLNFIIRLHETLRVEIPERDYAKLSNLDAIVAYLSHALSAVQAQAGRS